MTELADVERDALLLKRKIRQLGRPPTTEELGQIRGESSVIRDRAAKAMVNRLIVNRPEVISRGAPVSGDAAKRGLEEARARLERTDEFKAGCSACPAAQVTRRIDGGVTVLCGVEGSLLSSREDPQSMLTFCMGEFRECPSWQAEKEAIAAGRESAMATV